MVKNFLAPPTKDTLTVFPCTPCYCFVVCYVLSGVRAAAAAAPELLHAAHPRRADDRRQVRPQGHREPGENFRPLASRSLWSYDPIPTTLG